MICLYLLYCFWYVAAPEVITAVTSEDILVFGIWVLCDIELLKLLSKKG